MPETDLEELVALRGEAKYAQLGDRTVALIAELHAASAAPGQRDREQRAASLTGALHLRGAITSARSNDGDGAYARLDEAAIHPSWRKALTRT